MLFAFFILLSCEKENMVSEKEFVEYCYGLNLSLVDFAQKFRLSMYKDFRDVPFWRPATGAYIGREEANYITLKRDDQKYFSITYTPVTKEHIQAEQEMGSNMDEIKKFQAYLTIYFVDPAK
jgi:hypothetical protein